MTKNTFEQVKKYAKKDSENFKKYVETALDRYGLSKNLKQFGNVTYVNTGTSFITEVYAFFEVKTIDEYNKILNKKYADAMYKEFNLFLTTKFEIFPSQDCFRCTFIISHMYNLNKLIQPKNKGGQITEEQENSGKYIEE